MSLLLLLLIRWSGQRKNKGQNHRDWDTNFVFCQFIIIEFLGSHSNVPMQILPFCHVVFFLWCAYPSQLWSSPGWDFSSIHHVTQFLVKKRTFVQEVWEAYHFIFSSIHISPLQLTLKFFNIKFYLELSKLSLNK